MTTVINPGSRIGRPSTDEGWTNTYERAVAEAKRWHAKLAEDGIVDVELVVPDTPVAVDGRWRFGFRHRVTGVVVELETHGVAPLAAYEAARIFPPRVYWGGSSTASPQLGDWIAPGFVMTFRAAS